MQKPEKPKKFGRYVVNGAGGQTSGRWGTDQHFKFCKGVWEFSFNGFDDETSDTEPLDWDCWIGDATYDCSFKDKADFCDAIQEILSRQPKPAKFSGKDRTEISKIAKTLKSQLKVELKEIKMKGQLIEKIENLLQKI